MLVEAQVAINGSKEAIWAMITDIENAAKTISSIEKVEILERPTSGVAGLKWRETRKVFGKSATETMWITDAVENEYYKTGAESHGFYYVCTLSISEEGGGSALKMTHESRPQGFMTKVMSFLMGFLLKGAIRKMLLKDLNDIKAAVERAEANS